MWWKALLVWFLFMVGAIANGAFRMKFIIPVTGEALGHVISTAMLSCIILGITWATIAWVGPVTSQQALAIGTAWLLMTLGFEFGVGGLISHRTWPEMLADYNVLKGRVWVAVPLITFLAPWWMAKMRGLLP
jgi:hypothetical protein